MKRFLAVAVVLVVAAACGGSASAAEGWMRRSVRQATETGPEPTTYYSEYVIYGYRRYDPQWNQPDLYPKWYAGFHSRSFTTLGYPHGDIGLRGLPW